MNKYSLQNINLLIILLLAIGFSNCKKEESNSSSISNNSDYRNPIIGIYKGIRVNTSWNGSYYEKDSSDITINITKSNIDSLINLNFNPTTTSSSTFKYLNNNTFVCTSNYHPPTLKISNDSLFYHHQEGLGPIWYDCYAKKN